MGQHMVSPRATKDVVKTDATVPTLHMQLIFNISALTLFYCTFL
jgi:hypothetical protein